MTQSLAEFLLARIAEDEEVARAAVIPAHEGPNAYKPHPDLAEWQYAPYGRECSGEVEYVQTPEMLAHKYPDRLYVTCDSEGLTPAVGEDVGTHIARHDPARVLAECEAKREIVSEVVAAAATERSAAECAGFNGGAFDTAGDAILRSLCRVYADHPDYDEAWRP